MRTANRRAVLAVLVAAPVGALAALRLSRHQARQRDTEHTAVSEVWSCPMHPHVRANQPGQCPICGMNLVKASTAPTGPSDRMEVGPQAQQRIGLMIAPVTLGNFRLSLTVPAEIVADQRRAVSLSPKVEGWVRQLGVSVVGQRVQRGDLLFELYSPQLAQRQRDYIDLLTRLDSFAPKSTGMTAGGGLPDAMLASTARERFRMRAQLAAADIPADVLEDIERTRQVHDVVPVLATQDGVVTSIDAKKDAFVMPGQTVLSYSDPHALWAQLTLIPEQLRDLRGGESVEVRSSLAPDVKLTTRLDISTAVIDPLTRTARISVPLPHSSGTEFQRAFLPGMVFNATIRTKGRQALTVSRDAVIFTGQGNFVIVADDPVHFRQVRIQLGAENEDRVEVIDGLQAGQNIVTNGHFLLSAEASLHASDRT